MPYTEPQAEYFVRPVSGGYVCNALEFLHFGLTPLRVCDDGAARTLPIEAGAPFAAGSSQVFQPVPFKLVPAGQRSNALPEMQLQVADNGASFVDLLLPLMDSPNAVIVNWREFGGTAGAPVLLTKIYNLSIRTAAASFSGPTAYVLQFRDFTENIVPRARYDVTTAPGLL